MFNRKLKRQIEELSKELFNLQNEFHSHKHEKVVQAFEPRDKETIKEGIRISWLEQKVAELRLVQKFKGVVIYENKKHEVLESSVVREASKYDYFPDHFKRKYTLVRRENGELKQVHNVCETDISTAK